MECGIIFYMETLSGVRNDFYMDTLSAVRNIFYMDTLSRVGKFSI